MARTIDITTVQNVTIEYQLATPGDRILAFLLDAAIMVVGSLLLLQLARPWMEADSSWSVFFAMMAILLFFLYHLLFEILNNGQTPGKKAFKLRVLRLDGKEPGWSDAILRSALHLIDSLFSAGTLAFFMILTTRRAQRTGDLAANTTVVKTSLPGWRYSLEEILNISTLENSRPFYPQVRKLSESDMLFIKQAIINYQKYPNTAHEYAIEDLVTHLMPILGIERRPMNRPDFLKTLLRDYIVLTR
jgi:uncharacterized RDD family membrane protein YckC